ncbi:proteasome accessory factor PafA2 family protein, partial [Candidatus Poribacteria bacterium]|nr:proteasome accessory factor PafA2 family protein [Candidatus Poribacteria bacterium]
IEIQREYLLLAQRHFGSIGGDAEVDDLLQRWESVLERLDDDPMQLDREVDWVIKKRLIDEAQNRSGYPLNHPRLLEIESSYHRLGEESVFAALVRDGKVERLTTDGEVDHAVNHPPETTRAKFRGRFVKMANERRILCGVNWNYIQLYEPYQRLFLSTDPLQAEYEEGQRPASTSVQ